MSLIVENFGVSKINAAIYLNEDLIENLPHWRKTSDFIASVWDKLKSQLCSSHSNREVCNSLLNRIGVSKTDCHAQEALLPMIQLACQPGVEITPSEEDSGVYFLSLQGKNFAVFKVGEKRARMELLARKMAHQIGLEQHAIPGVACSIAYPQFPKEEIQVELWNGNVKSFCSMGSSEEDLNQSVEEDNFGLNRPFTINGILEPFLDERAPITSEEFLSLTVYSLFIGLRDGKLNGCSGSVLFDVEDCMPERFIPDSSPNRKVAATHLPMLNHGLSKELIPVEKLRLIAKKVDAVYQNIFAFLGELTNESVLFADLASEDTLPAKTRRLIGFDNQCWDEGGIPSVILEPKLIMEQHPAIKVTNPATDRMLTVRQLEACQMRIRRLHEALAYQVLKEEPISTLALVCEVDPFYKEQLLALRKSGFDRIPAPSIIGAHNANVVKALFIEPSQQMRLAHERTRSSPPLERSPSESCKPPIPVRVSSLGELTTLIQRPTENKSDWSDDD